VQLFGAVEGVTRVICAALVCGLIERMVHFRTPFIRS
jgi:hypothetical protein